MKKVLMKIVTDNILRFYFNFAPWRLGVLALIFFVSTNAQTLAPGAPGNDAHWTSAGKQAVGTSNTLESKVWFTLEGGTLTEVFYPTVETANVQQMQFFVRNKKTGRIETERDDAAHRIESLPINRTKNASPVTNLAVYKNFKSPASLAFKQTNRSKSGDWRIEKTYVTNPKNNSLLIAVEFFTSDANNELYIYHDPSMGNSGMHDTAWSEGGAFLAADGDFASALVCRRCKFEEMTNGFLGTSDGLGQLKNAGKIAGAYQKAEKGNVVQVARVAPVFSKPTTQSKYPIILGNGKANETRINFEIALGFGKTAGEALKASRDSLIAGFDKVYADYQAGWIDYLKTIPKVEPKYEAQFNVAAMTLRAHEDKTFRGANVASITYPWGSGKNANEPGAMGYHLVWSRDLYQVATAFMALGDKAAAVRALEYLLYVQQKPDGSFPQNSWLDGRLGWGNVQMDEVAYPLILAYQLGKTDRQTYEKHLKKIADYIVKNGPASPQERWEEEQGYSPSTIAAEIAGLVCAAEIARKNGDNSAAEIYLKTADDWAANIEKWTATTTGKYGDGNYYLRITQNGKPDAGDKIELNNGSGTFDEREILDAGFLELVRLGIKPADDPLIQKSLKIIDEHLMVKTPNGEGFFRYTRDGYGETLDGKRWNWDDTYRGNGHLWALLSGERGQFEIADCGLRIADLKTQDPRLTTQDCLGTATTRLDAMMNFANDALMIPEQIWSTPQIPANPDLRYMPPLKFGEGNGSATPLAWSMAQFIRLATNLKAGRNLETPDIVFDRYVKKK